MEERNYCSITIRIPFSMIEELTADVKEKRFRDKSEAVRNYINLGKKVDAILRMQNDPKKKKEFDAKYKSLLKENNVQKSMETWDVDQLDNIIFYAMNLKNKKVQQLVMSFK
jgi:Arc/MetJ-type ribon-helix-helix transcriptional regulator